MTALTVHAIRNPGLKPIHDYIDRVERASITESNNLLIFVEARLTNAPHCDRYTMVVPLSQIMVDNWTVLPGYTATNTPPTGWYHLNRGGIVSGWGTMESAALRPVPIGPPVIYDEAEWARKCKGLPGAEQALYPVVMTGTNWQEQSSVPCKFIYVDLTRPEAFTLIKVEAFCVTRSNNGLYFVLPFAVAGDIATMPVQIIILLFTFQDAYGH